MATTIQGIEVVHYSFDAPDTEDNIIFEHIEGYPDKIKAATLEKLVEYLTCEKGIDIEFRTTFLLTYSSFTTAEQLLNMLRDRFFMKATTNSTEEWERKLKCIRIRVINTLKLWVCKSKKDFEIDEFRNKYIAFLEEIAVYHPIAASIVSIINRQLIEVEHTTFYSTPPPPSIVPKTISAVISLLDFHPEEVARQLSLIENRLYSSIPHQEFLNEAWTKSDKYTKAPNTLKLTNHFNLVSNLLSYEIIKPDSVKQRSKVLKHVIRIGAKCLELANFNGAMEVVSALNSSPVYRLKNTWEILEKSKCHKLFVELQTVMSREKGFMEYRKRLRDTTPPCVPYIGLYFTHIIFTEECYPSMINGNLINFLKKRKLNDIIQEIMTYQSTSYYFSRVEVIENYFRNTETLSDDELFTLSKSREHHQKSATRIKKKKSSIKNTPQEQPDPQNIFGEMEVIPGYLFTEPDDPSNIIIENDVIKAGTKKKIVEYLTHPNVPHHINICAFLTAYNRYMATSQLVELLIMRFNMPKPKNPTREQASSFRTKYLIPIQFRVLQFLKLWVEHYISDLKDEIITEVKSFLETAANNYDFLKNVVTHIISLIDSNRKIEKSPVAATSAYIPLLGEFSGKSPAAFNNFKAQIPRMMPKRSKKSQLSSSQPTNKLSLSCNHLNRMKLNSSTPSIHNNNNFDHHNDNNNNNNNKTSSEISHLSDTSNSLEKSTAINTTTVTATNTTEDIPLSPRWVRTTHSNNSSKERALPNISLVRSSSVPTRRKTSPTSFVSPLDNLNINTIHDDNVIDLNHPTPSTPSSPIIIITDSNSNNQTISASSSSSSSSSSLQSQLQSSSSTQSKGENEEEWSISKVFLNFPVEEIAEQIFWNTKRALENLTSRELYHPVSTASDMITRSSCYNLFYLYHNYYLLQRWIATEIIRSPSIQSRVAVITSFIQMAEYFIKVGDYHDGFAIINSIKQLQEKCLHATWKWIEGSTLEIFEQLLTQSDDLPDITPLYLIIQKQIEVLEEPDLVRNDLINFEKLSTLYSLFNDMRRYRTFYLSKSPRSPISTSPSSPLSLSDPQITPSSDAALIQQYLSKLSILTEDELENESKNMNNEAPEGITPPSVRKHVDRKKVRNRYASFNERALNLKFSNYLLSSSFLKDDEVEDHFRSLLTISKESLLADLLTYQRHSIANTTNLFFNLKLNMFGDLKFDCNSTSTNNHIWRINELKTRILKVAFPDMSVRSYYSPPSSIPNSYQLTSHHFSNITSNDDNNSGNHHHHHQIYYLVTDEFEDDEDEEGKRNGDNCHRSIAAYDKSGDNWYYYDSHFVAVKESISKMDLNILRDDFERFIHENELYHHRITPCFVVLEVDLEVISYAKMSEIQILIL